MCLCYLQVQLVFCDYRKVQGTYDKVVSIEMLEAVGHEHLPTFFDAVSRYLKPGGRAAVQVITLPNPVSYTHLTLPTIYSV